MAVVATTIHFPEDLWRAEQALTLQEGDDPTTVILRAVEEYVTDTHKHQGRPRPGKYQKLVQALSTPTTALNLSARPATALHAMNIPTSTSWWRWRPVSFACERTSGTSRSGRSRRS